MRDFIENFFDCILVIIFCILGLAGMLALPSALILVVIDLCFNLNIIWWVYLLLFGYGIIFICILKYIFEIGFEDESIYYSTHVEDDDYLEF